MSLPGNNPNGFLYAYVDTGLPYAHKWAFNTAPEVVVDVSTVSESYQLFTDWIANMSTAATAGGGGAWTWSEATGKVTITNHTGGTLQYRWPSLAGVMAGFGRRPMTSSASTNAATLVSTHVPAGAVHILGAEITETQIQREKKHQPARWMRTFGYQWGGSRVYRWTLTIQKESLEAFRWGFCTSGKVRLDMKNAAAVSTSNPSGYQDGWVLGVDRVQFTSSRTPDLATVSMLVAEDE